MKNLNKIVAGTIKATVEKALRVDANKTSCTIIYQPKAPAKLEKFKKNRS